MTFSHSIEETFLCYINSSFGNQQPWPIGNSFRSIVLEGRANTLIIALEPMAGSWTSTNPRLYLNSHQHSFYWPMKAEYVIYSGKQGWGVMLRCMCLYLLWLGVQILCKLFFCIIFFSSLRTAYFHLLQPHSNHIHRKRCLSCSAVLIYDLRRRSSHS